MSDLRFSDLRVGDSFDFIGPVPRFNSFHERCTKTSSRGYSWFHPERHAVIGSTVGTTSVKVYHVERKQT
jgi:hypothetical protein